MRMMTRRAALAGTLAAGLTPRKPRADEPQGLPGLKLVQPPVAAPAISFIDADGKTHTLKEYAGSAVVLNLWATWCAPCVAELPSLDMLAAKLVGQGMAVLALSSDHGGAAAVRQFYRAHAIRTLPILLDPEGAAMHAFGASGIPVTYVLDRNGLERGYVEGGENWGTDAAIARLRRLLGS